MLPSHRAMLIFATHLSAIISARFGDLFPSAPQFGPRLPVSTAQSPYTAVPPASQRAAANILVDAAHWRPNLSSTLSAPHSSGTRLTTPEVGLAALQA